MRVDDEDISYRPVKRERTGSEWLGIIALAVLIGTLSADVVRLLTVSAWANYQMSKAADAARTAQTNAAIQLQNAANARSEQTQRQQAAMIEQARQRAYEAKYNSDECRFWRDTNAINPSNKALKGIADNCP